MKFVWAGLMGTCILVKAYLTLTKYLSSHKPSKTCYSEIINKQYTYRCSLGKAQTPALCNRSAWQCVAFRIDWLVTLQTSVQTCIIYKLLVLSVTCILSSSGRTYQLGEGALDDSQNWSPQSCPSYWLHSDRPPVQAKSRKTSRNVTVKCLTLHFLKHWKYIQRLLFH